MKLISAHIQGFRSFSKPIDVEFEDLTGLVFVTGKNEVEPALEGNGVGKSSLFEAIYWCLFGKTSRGLKAGDIKNWNADYAPVVELVLETQDTTISLYRSWGPNRLQMAQNGAAYSDVDQETVEAAIGVSADAFLYSVYFAQFVPLFMDLAPASQMALLSEVLNLGFWEQASDRAAKGARDVESEQQERGLELSAMKGKLSAYEEQVEDAETTQLISARARYHAALSMKNEILSATEVCEKLEAAVRKSKDKIEKSLQKDKERLSELAELQKDLNLEAGSLSGKEYEVQRQITKSEQLGKGLGAVCPTCHQKVNHKLLKGEAEREIKDLNRDLAQIQLKKKKVVEQLNEVLAEAREVARHSEGATHTTFQAQVKALENAVGIIERCEEDLARIVGIELPEIPSSLLRNIEGLRDAMGRLQKTLKDARAREEGFKFWQKEFKELRLYLIEESLTQLEVEANSALHELGLEEWSLEFDIERETKGGKVKQGFSVLIHSPINDRLVPWAAWSGGESQRLRLAVAMGLSSLICSRLGISPNVEFWDEPSTWLSTSGITDLLQALKSRAEREGKQIWLADHRSFDYGGFAKTVTIIKTQDGSTIR